jgi:hypothetical protein
MRIPTVTALLALTLTPCLAAQQPGGSPPADPITSTFRGRIAGLHRNLAQAFDSIPESLFSYKPTPAQLSIGYIAQHLAADNAFFCNNFGNKKAPPIEGAEAPDSVRATWPKARLIANLKASFTFCDEAFAQLTDASLAEPITITFNNNSRQSIRSAMVLGHALDLADHYSQLANYMRLNNILPPSALPRRGN